MKVAVIVLIVLIIAGAAVAAFVILGSDSNITVPDVVGQKTVDAVDALNGAGLAYSVQHTYDAQAQTGQVTREQPAGGAQAAKGSMVVLYVSQGSQNVAVPDVAGQTVQQARTALAALGLTLKSVAGSSGDTPAGQIYQQTPGAGTQASRGSVVTVYYNHTSSDGHVPALAGLTQPQCADRLKGAGYRLGAVTSQPSTTVMKGEVISQSAPATENLPRGSKVSIVVSSGPPLVAVPDVLNMPYQRARSTLTSQGFQVRMSWRPGTGMEPDSVIKMRPAAGSLVPKGSLVRLIVEQDDGPFM
jgi:eukaryotic-like serine/threonine-protein kinase